jgi:hypothetical protein
MHRNEPERTGTNRKIWKKNFLVLSRAEIRGKPKISGEFARRFVVHDTVLNTKLC